MKEKIIEVQNYFKNRIINGEYEFLKCDEFKAVISVDGFIFNLWIANGLVGFKFWEITSDEYFMRLPEMNENERIMAWISIEPLVIYHRYSVLRAEKLAKLESLKKELNID
jgi:hypothetical protein